MLGVVLALLAQTAPSVTPKAPPQAELGPVEPSTPRKAMPRPVEMVEFDRMDANHDGVVDGGELAMSYRVRARADRLPPQEVVRVTRSYVRSYLALLDKDRSGGVSKAELLAGLERRDRMLKGKPARPSTSRIS